jgi:DNA polymerase III delta subunit
MPEIAFFNFKKIIKDSTAQFPVTILYGYNEFLGEEIIDAFCQGFIETKNDFNYRRYYFDSENETVWEEIIDEANTSSFFVQSRKIIVATIRDEKKISLKSKDEEILKEYFHSPNPNTILIVYISLNTTKDDFKQIKKLKIDKLLKKLDAPQIYNVNLDKISEDQTKNYIQSYLKNCGISITASAMDKIIEIKNNDFISILHQLPKLVISDIQEKSIDSEDINKIITGVEAHSIWDLTDAIESENTTKYLKVLKYLFIKGIKATLIIGTLITHYNKIYIAKFLLKRNMPVQDIGKALGQHPFFLNKFINSTRNFSQKRLHHILKMIYYLDYESKTAGEESARLSLQNFAFRIKFLSHNQ